MKLFFAIAKRKFVENKRTKHVVTFCDSEKWIVWHFYEMTHLNLFDCMTLTWYKVKTNSLAANLSAFKDFHIYSFKVLD